MYDKAACDWLKANRDHWMKWIPQTLSPKPRIYLGGMFTLSGPNWRQPGTVPGKSDYIYIIIIRYVT